jgi:hypothetical protein
MFPTPWCRQQLKDVREALTMIAVDDIGVRVGQRVAHAGLRGEVHHAFEVREVLKDLSCHRVQVFDARCARRVKRS